MSCWRDLIGATFSFSEGCSIGCVFAKRRKINKVDSARAPAGSCFLRAHLVTNGAIQELEVNAGTRPLRLDLPLDALHKHMAEEVFRLEKEGTEKKERGVGGLP